MEPSTPGAAKCRADRFPLPSTLAEVRDEPAVIADLGGELLIKRFRDLVRRARRKPVFIWRERRVYERLREAHVLRISGFHVPQLVRFNDELMAIEMTIVTPPFVLDFAGAYLNSPPAFSDQIWADWEAAKREQLGISIRTVKAHRARVMQKMEADSLAELVTMIVILQLNRDRMMTNANR